MATTKITDLTAYTDPVNTDVLPIVDVTSDVTKKVSIANVMKNASLGTAAAPGISFDGDPNTGIYSPGANQVAITTDGTQRLLIDSAGAVTIAGDLTVNGTTTNINTQNLIVEDKNVVLGDVAVPTDVTADGGGITLKGTTDKTINWVDATDAWTSSERFSYPTGSAAAPTLTFTGDPNTGIYSPGADQVAISTNGTGRLFIGSGGRVGVDTSSAASKFVVSKAGAEGIEIEPGDTSGVNLTRHYNRSNDAFVTSSVYASNHIFYRGVNEAVRITSAGLVGVGTSSPGVPLEVSATTPIVRVSLSSDSTKFGNFYHSAGTTAISSRNGASNGSIAFQRFDGTTTSTSVTIDPSGNVGIGTSSPGSTFHVVSSSTALARFQGPEYGQVRHSDGTRVLYTQVYSNEARLFTESSTPLLLGTSDTERLRITSAGNVGIGTTSPGSLLSIYGDSVDVVSSYVENNSASGTGSVDRRLLFGVGGGTASGISIWQNSGVIEGTPAGGLALTAANSAGSIKFGTGVSRTERARIDSSGTFRVKGAGTAGVNDAVQLNGSAPANSLLLDASGRLLVGTSSALDANTSLQVASTAGQLGIFRFSSVASDETNLTLYRSKSSTIGTITALSNGDAVGGLFFSGANGTGYNRAAAIICEIDGAVSGGGAGDMPGRLVFSTTRDGQSSPTEAFRVDRNGNLLVATTNSNIGGTTTVGLNLNAEGVIRAGASSSAPCLLNRITDDGVLLYFQQNGNTEGDISVSGTTVSYNGAHLSRWSQLPGGAERIEILRGSVLSNIDEMCEWGDEDNEQLNRMKVSDVEGDKNVSGVFQAWDDDDDTYTNDFYCAMTGDFIIRIGAGVTVERGDLLMSAGDGTAKPQDDDIIRSKTIAKVTSTNVSCTYDDGSYCVPCVLMAC